MINDVQLIQLRLEAIRIAAGDIDKANAIMTFLTGDLISNELAQAKQDGMQQTGPSVITLA